MNNDEEVARMSVKVITYLFFFVTIGLFVLALAQANTLAIAGIVSCELMGSAYLRYERKYGWRFK